MRKHFYRALTLAAACAMMGGMVFSSAGATRQKQVDTIVLETETAEEDIPVDLSWKTAQDKGRWIEELEIAGDATSLILILNNLEETEEETAASAVKDSTDKVRPRRSTIPGNSRLIYYTKTGEDEWQEIFAINCAISGGQTGENSDIYGAYRLESAFGSENDPGSLVPFHQITSKDYWTTDTEDWNFGQIVSFWKDAPISDSYVKLENMKAFSNYGMILKPETEGEAYPALVLNCQQAAVVDRTFPGIQLSETYVRMLIQSVDEETRILISGEIEDLEGM